MPPSVAIVVLNWRGAADTLACLGSLLRLETPRTAIIVCDNASGDGSVAAIRDWATDQLPLANGAREAAGLPRFAFAEARAGDRVPPGTLALVETGANLGFAGGNNVGLRLALASGYDACWVLNNDTIVRPDALAALMARLAADPKIGLCGSTLVYADDPDRIQCQAGASFSRFKGRGAAIGQGRRLMDAVPAAAVEAELAFVCGASMLVTRAFLEQVGLMREDYFLYWEDAEWAMRARGRFRLGYAADSLVLHRLGASIGTRDFTPGSLLSDYYMTRNRRRFCARFSPAALPFAVADILRRTAAAAGRGDWRRAGVLLQALLGLPYRPADGRLP